MTARELIEQEMNTRPSGELDLERSHASVKWCEAAERVIDGLQRRVEELEEDAQARMHWLDEGDKERYRDRLDKWVRDMLCGHESAPYQPSTDKRPYIEFLIDIVKDYIAAIDAVVEERK